VASCALQFRALTLPACDTLGATARSANNYLGLSNHPAVASAAVEAIKTHGFGLSSVRFICGTQDLHKSLEARISRFHGTQDTILYPSCFDANVSRQSWLGLGATWVCAHLLQGSQTRSAREPAVGIAGWG
jgi:7-keto-8-aminopelargonate synthetase-like enzyme